MTEWMHQHLRISIWPYDDVDALDKVEQAVLNRLDPPLNLKHMPLSETRQRLKDLRREVSIGA